MRISLLLSLAVLAFCLKAETGVPMKNSKGPSSDPVPAATECRPGAALSACGLPSEVVIDMSKTCVKHSDQEWQTLLSPLQYRVARQQGTEPPFQNAYWDNHRDGVYLCVGCGSPLFDSRHKFESGTGWPSFWQVLEPAFVGTLQDRSHGMLRTEVHCVVCGSHLGHLFDDGPRPTGLRYCINSASLRFLERKNYEAWTLEKALPGKDKAVGGK